MRNTASIAVLALLASACSQPAPPPEATASETAMEVAADVPGGLAIDGKPNAGVFEVTSAAGKTWTTTITADGKMSMLVDGKTKTGTWSSTGPGNYCDTVDGKTTCYKEEIVNGVYTSTNEKDPKDTGTVKRIS